jgi:hypothetical protein
MSFLTSLPGPGIAGEAHIRCSSKRCFAHGVDTATYQPRHADECSENNVQCQLVGFDSEQIATIIRDNKIPLVRCVESQDGTMELSLISGNTGDDYISISHVWSDGLGNFTQNKLPKCQVRWIKRALEGFQLYYKGMSDWERESRRVWTGSGSAIPEFVTRRLSFQVSQRSIISSGSTPLFWMDTFCIPVGSENQAYRVKAINSMAAIYASAQQNLIIDSELHSLPRDKNGTAEAARILCST